jgi:hypothetical protein
MNDFAFRGEIAEAVIIARLVKRGDIVLLPFGVKKYDIVVDRAGKFIRGQCKMAHHINGCLKFSTCSGNGNRGRQDYKGLADVFWVYYPVNEKIYEIPVDQVSSQACQLRINPLKAKFNGGMHEVRWAKDYEI